jgi:hypothetical protein
MHTQFGSGNLLERCYVEERQHCKDIKIYFRETGSEDVNVLNWHRTVFSSGLSN